MTSWASLLYILSAIALHVSALVKTLKTFEYSRACIAPFLARKNSNFEGLFCKKDVLHATSIEYPVVL